MSVYILGYATWAIASPSAPDSGARTWMASASVAAFGSFYIRFNRFGPTLDQTRASIMILSGLSYTTSPQITGFRPMPFSPLMSSVNFCLLSVIFNPSPRISSISGTLNILSSYLDWRPAMGGLLHYSSDCWFWALSRVSYNHGFTWNIYRPRGCGTITSLLKELGFMEPNLAFSAGRQGAETGFWHHENVLDQMFHWVYYYRVVTPIISTL